MAKHKYIETPEKLWEYFKAYEKEVKSSPFLQHDFVGKDGMSVYREKERCLTMEGFEDWLAEHSIITDASDYFENKNDSYTAYLPVCRAIKRKIRRDQIEGGMAGIYNPSITQRINSLTDKSESTVEVKSYDVSLKL